jgi:hypothetical protein
MIQRARQSQSSSKAVVHPVVLFGVDRHGKPTAARFPESQARLAAKAAEQLDLRVLTIDNTAVAELAATLPVGRIHASGKGFVPNVRGDLYAKLLAMAGPPTPVTQSSTLTLRGAQSNGGGSNTKKPAQDRLPKDWNGISPGHLVVAQEALRMAGTTQSLLSRTATCSLCAGVTTRGTAGLRGIAAAWHCFAQLHTTHPRPNPSTNLPSRVLPGPRHPNILRPRQVYRTAGRRLASASLSSHFKTVPGGRGGKPS